MFINEDFLLTTETAKRLYHQYAKDMPIIDYHCHLTPSLIAKNHRFQTITELWLEGDHYKWRAMRANGISERLITGDGSDWEKFEAWAETVENLLGNALYHWTHLELKVYFNITKTLSKKTAKEIYEQCNQYLASHEVTTQSLIRHSDVRLIGTTDDILSDLEAHKAIKRTTDLNVIPSFRPDPILNIQLDFAAYLEKCREKAQDSLTTYESFLKFVKTRVSYFNKVGCKSADHGFKEFLFEAATDAEIEVIYQKGVNEENISQTELAKWQGRLLTELGREYAKYGWIMQLHIGAIRSNNTRLLNELGENIGTDSIYDQPGIAGHLNAFLDGLDVDNQLPKTVLYNLNPSYNDVFASVCGNFQSNNQGIKGKVQFGAPWWFGDNYNGMVNQLEVLSNYGILMNFIGMLTDSRSFISYPRHDYFRRILCQFIGNKVESGFYPNDEAILSKMVKNIAYENVARFFESTN
ncbi:glucuronate isomerase [Enterococcus thailandicus]|uniref:glucuronate isomerase n=1 Tax=Enterococcus thailandicus TaxID=417368 RepID=UPI0022E7D143|nr:glucuronate isomerase [Enterococcus thailandicus]